MPVFLNAITGSGIGFLSGMVGIGGGIFLSPLLYLSRWGEAKAIAACTAIFILTNSIAGLLGQLLTYEVTLPSQWILALLLAVFLGGQLGIRLTIFRLSAIAVKRITAVLILIVALRLLWKYIGTV